MKQILVTGSLGYIGSVLIPYLNENNLECVGYDTGFFKDCYLYPTKEQKTILKDMRDFTEDELRNIDTVVHLAGISNDPLGDLKPEKVYDPSRVYSLRLARLCKDTGIKFIFASSCSVYGRGSPQLLSEESAIDPQTPYSLNKLQIESDLGEISDKDFSPVILRFATVFGLSPRMRFDLFINMFVAMALTTKKIILNSDGKAWRPNVHIDDVCKAIRYCIDYDQTLEKPLILNVGDTHQNFQIIEIAEMIKNEVPGCEITYLQNIRNSSPLKDLVKDKKIQDGVDTRTYQVSFELIKNALPGFRCDWSVQKGIQAMIHYFKELPLTEENFRNIDFYRLQKMEHLLQNGYLTDDLIWKRVRDNGNIIFSRCNKNKGSKI